MLGGGTRADPLHATLGHDDPRSPLRNCYAETRPGFHTCRRHAALEALCPAYTVEDVAELTAKCQQKIDTIKAEPKHPDTALLVEMIIAKNQKWLTALASLRA